MVPMSHVTSILAKIESGDPSAAAELLPLVYNELRKLAAAKLANERSDHSLQATALVHEAYLRLIGDGKDEPSWDDRGHFFAAAAVAMRRILVESARRKGRLKRGGDLFRHEYTEDNILVPELREDLLDLDQALNKLSTVDPIAANLVQLRYFAGLTLKDAASSMNLAPRTAERLWAYARAWLFQELKSQTSTD